MLKHLNVDEMVALVSPWVQNGKRRAVFASIPEIAALLPKVTAAHEGVLAVRPAAAPGSAELRALMKEVAEDDREHDALARAISSGLDAHRALCLAEQPADVERAATCDEASAKLLPGGLAIVNVSPLAESGNAARAAKLLEDEPEIGAFLKGIQAPGKVSKATMLDVVQRWIAAGVKLGKHERAREELAAKEAGKPVRVETIVSARSRWTRVVSLVLSNLEESDAPAEAIETIRGPVLRASERAAKRYATGGGDANVVEPEGDAPAAAGEAGAINK